MQYIIDIPEHMKKSYEDMIKHCDYKTFEIPRIVVKSIANGIPLPKGHGRIADMDEAIKCIEDVEGEDAIWAVNLIEWACSKRTIIEADKED